MDLKVLEKLAPNKGPVEKILVYVRKEAEKDEHLQKCILDESKTVDGMVEHIKNYAQKAERMGNMAMIEDQEIYGQAIHYFLETSETLDEEKEEKEEKVVMADEKSTKTISIFDLMDE